MHSSQTVTEHELRYEQHADLCGLWRVQPRPIFYAVRFEQFDRLASA